MATPASDIDDTPFGAPPRPPAEEVLQSAEEAVLVNPASVDTLQGSEPVVEAAEPTTTRSPYADRLAQHVAEKPMQSALVALAAGALLAFFVKSALSRRRR